MRIFFLVSIILFSSVILKAQNEYNPFESIGKKATVLTLSNGRYKENYTSDTLKRIGSVMYNTITGQIAYFVVEDTLFSESSMEPEVVSRWMSPDPLASKYPSMSPYEFAADNPVIYVDPDGQDWFYYQAEGSNAADWHWHEGTELQIQTSKDAEGNAVYTAVQGHAAVVIFNGSRNEQLGANSNINGVGAVTAEVKVYGPGGADDVSDYTGYTLTSNAPQYTPIDEGQYTVRRRNSAGSGSLPKHYQVFENGVDNIRTMDGVINNNAPNQVRPNGDGYKAGIFIHRTNNSGSAVAPVSVGCLLIAPGNQWNNFNNQLLPLGNNLDNAANSRAFTLIVNRTGSTHNPVLDALVENNCGSFTPVGENIGGGTELNLGGDN